MTRKWNQAHVALVVLVSITSLIGAVVYSRNIKQEPSPKFHQPATVRDVPLVVSEIKDLQITGVRLVNQGTAQAAIEIDVTNNRDSAVMSLDFIWRHKQDSGGIAVDGLLEGDNPRMVIPPHALKTFTWFLGEVPQGKTIFLGSAIFADGKEEGDQRSLEGIRKDRTNYQNRKQAQIRMRMEVNNESNDDCLVDDVVLIFFDGPCLGTLRQHLGNTRTDIWAASRPYQLRSRLESNHNQQVC